MQCHTDFYLFVTESPIILKGGVVAEMCFLVVSCRDCVGFKIP